MTTVYAFKDGSILIGSNKEHAEQAWDLGALPLFQADNDDVAWERLKEHITMVGATAYLTELMDRPFTDVDQLIAMKARFS